ncbi:MAG: insulinase family protein [Spirochaetaceae bacterium]|nr:insulinase family protein [Spirochaetaceae bacterium]
MNAIMNMKKSAALRRAFAVFTAFLFFTANFSGCASSGGGKGDLYGGLGKPSDPVPLMGGVRTGTLPSGLRYYILPNSRPENRAFLTLAVNAGAILEEEDEQGLAHFVEHMGFNGTRRFPGMELVNYLRSLGMRFGPDVNAYTSFDATVYGIEVPVETGGDGLKRIPARALDVIDDWAHGITFDLADVDSERAVVTEEYRIHLGAGERVQRKLAPVLFRGSIYADRDVIGLPEIIANAPASKLENFYRKWYRADNMAVILVGDFDAAALEAELPLRFTVPAPRDALNRPYYELPEPRKGNFRTEIITDTEYPYTRVDAYYKAAPRPLKGTLESYRDGVMDYLIGDILSVRFEDAMMKPQTPYSDAGAWAMRYGRESGFHVLTAIAKPDMARESFTEIMLEKESLVRYGFTNTEIDRAGRSLLSALSAAVSEQDRENSGSRVSALTDYFLQGRIIADAEWELDAVTRLLPGISAAELARRVKSYYDTEDLTVVVIGSESDLAGLPREADIRRIIADTKRAKIERPAETRVSEELLDREPRPGAVAGETVDSETGAILWELSNGARIILKPTNNKNNEIILHAVARGGTAAVPESDFISADLAAEMGAASGLGPYSRTELVRKLADKQVSVSFSADSFTRGIDGSSTVWDLKSLFELLYLTFTQPRIDEDAVRVLLDQYRTSLIRQGENPENVFYDEARRFAYGNDYRFAPMRIEDLEKVDIAAARRFLSRALNPADFTFVFTGNLDTDALRSYAEIYLASIPRGESWNSFGEIEINRPRKILKTIYKGREEKSIVFQGWFMPAAFNVSDSIKASVLREYLDIKLLGEIRNRLGGVYSIQANSSLSSLPPPGELAMETMFYCDPGRAEELRAEVIRHIESVAQGTIDGDIFAKAVEAMKKAHENALQSNSFIANYYANLAVIFNQPLSTLDKRPFLYDSVRPDDLKDICLKLLPRGPAVLILYPEGREGRD